MIAGAGGNIAVQIGENGVVLVDSGSAAFSDAVLTTVRKLSSLPIRCIINTNGDINTSGDPDHVGGKGSSRVRASP